MVSFTSLVAASSTSPISGVKESLVADTGGSEETTLGNDILDSSVSELVSKTLVVVVVVGRTGFAVCSLGGDLRVVSSGGEFTAKALGCGEDSCVVVDSAPAKDGVVLMLAAGTGAEKSKRSSVVVDACG
jgi:hypothetical protein